MFWRRFQVSHSARDVLMRQLCQRSTIVALLNAVALLASWKIDPAKLEALGLLLSFVDTVVLAVVQEKEQPGSPPPPPFDAGAPQ